MPIVSGKPLPYIYGGGLFFYPNSEHTPHSPLANSHANEQRGRDAPEVSL